MGLANAISANYRCKSNMTADGARVIEDIRSELCQMPGHASYFSEAIEAERKRIDGLGVNYGPRVDYDFNRRLAFETLSHLPSPEAIGVLGSYLSDERDFHEIKLSAETDECVSGGSTGNSTHAIKALENSDLRDKPYQEGSIVDRGAVKAAWIAWWDEIKSGRRTFSFKGQAVEYRFKPDGTWDTIPIANPPDDGPQLVSVAAPMNSKDDSAPRASTGEQKPNGSWVWIVTGMIGGLALVLWLGVRRFA
jgi:hypothetical protein